MSEQARKDLLDDIDLRFGAHIDSNIYREPYRKRDSERHTWLTSKNLVEPFGSVSEAEMHYENTTKVFSVTFSRLFRTLDKYHVELWLRVLAKQHPEMWRSEIFDWIIVATILDDGSGHKIDNLIGNVDLKMYSEWRISGVSADDAAEKLRHLDNELMSSLIDGEDYLSVNPNPGM